MAKEELRKEATSTVEWESTPMVDRPLFVHGYITGAEPREKRIEKLEKENEELKETVTKMNNVITETFSNLTKAKEIIKKFSEFANLEVEYDPEHPQEHTDLWDELCKDTEQFLNSEVEK